jgi:hypothetical protein
MVTSAGRSARTASLARSTGLALAATVLAGCAIVGPADDPPADAAGAFARALGRGDGEAACRLLIEGAVGEVKRSEGRPCPQAITSMSLPTSDRAALVDVYGINARVVTDSDVLFLSNSGAGWKVIAAGCREQSGDRPYSCLVSAG